MPIIPPQRIASNRPLRLTEPNLIGAARPLVAATAGVAEVMAEIQHADEDSQVVAAVTQYRDQLDKFEAELKTQGDPGTFVSQLTEMDQRVNEEILNTLPTKNAQLKFNAIRARGASERFRRVAFDAARLQSQQAKARILDALPAIKSKIATAQSPGEEQAMLGELASFLDSAEQRRILTPIEASNVRTTLAADLDELKLSRMIGDEDFTTAILAANSPTILPNLSPDARRAAMRTIQAGLNRQQARADKLEERRKDLNAALMFGLAQDVLNRERGITLNQSTADAKLKLTEELIKGNIDATGYIRAVTELGEREREARSADKADAKAKQEQLQNTIGSLVEQQRLVAERRQLGQVNLPEGAESELAAVQALISQKLIKPETAKRMIDSILRPQPNVAEAAILEERALRKPFDPLLLNNIATALISPQEKIRLTNKVLTEREQDIDEYRRDLKSGLIRLYNLKGPFAILNSNEAETINKAVTVGTRAYQEFIEQGLSPAEAKGKAEAVTQQEVPRATSMSIAPSTDTPDARQAALDQAKQKATLMKRQLSRTPDPEVQRKYNELMSQILQEQQAIGR